MPEYDQPEPGVVEITGEQEIPPDLVVVPNRHAQLVPNIGVIGGAHSVLVVETGMGPRNAEKVLKFAADHAKGRRLYLTTTHFHPEHAFGARVFAGQATYLVNRAQADDGVPEDQVAAAFASRVGPVFANEAIQAAGGAAWADPALSGRDRSIAVITALVAQGVTGDRLGAHLDLARQQGLDDDALTALMVLLAGYLGYAHASLAMEVIHARAAARLSAAAGGAQETTG